MTITIGWSRRLSYFPARLMRHNCYGDQRRMHHATGQSPPWPDGAITTMMIMTTTKTNSNEMKSIHDEYSATDQLRRLRWPVLVRTHHSVLYTLIPRFDLYTFDTITDFGSLLRVCAKHTSRWSPATQPIRSTCSRTARVQPGSTWCCPQWDATAATASSR